MLRAYHMIGLDSADFFRLRQQRITEEEIVQKGWLLYNRIVSQGMLTTRAIRQDPLQEEHSRQFHLDHLVGDDQYIYLSVGKRYWNELERTNFGFIFDVEDLLLKQQAILRTQDLLSLYESLLDEVVCEFVPNRRTEEFSPEEITRLMVALDDPSIDYVSPNDAYYTLIYAVEYQKQEVPQVQEATGEFIRRAHLLQEKYQKRGKEALMFARNEGETGQFELLVQGELLLDKCIGIIREGKEASE